ncbi:hypothetical protein K439DRAFT_1339000, partial [Ramaria rubella]
QYALSEGQPVDAVVDGISALHAAAAGGSEHVARLLIDNGADVNFSRHPARSPPPRTYIYTHISDHHYHHHHHHHDTSRLRCIAHHHP